MTLGRSRSASLPVSVTVTRCGWISEWPCPPEPSLRMWTRQQLVIPVRTPGRSMVCLRMASRLCSVLRVNLGAGRWLSNAVCVTSAPSVFLRLWMPECT